MKSIFLISLAVLLPMQAYASVLTINSADVRKGFKSLEAGIRWDFDNESRSRDNFRQYVLEAEYSPTDYWGIGFDFVVERERGEGTRYAVTAFENTFQFFKQGKDAPFSLGLRADYRKSHISEESDEIAARLLFRYRDERFEARLNLGGDRQVGSDAENGVNGDVRTSLRYRVNDQFIPAIDYLGDTGRLDNMPRYSEQKHRLGPVLYGNLDEAIGYQVGYLAGISRAAPDHTFKIAVEHKF